MLTSRQLRQKFLDFFASKGHTVLPSSSLVPKEDPTVLFNTAGMQPIVPYLLGQPHPGGTRLVNSQKCIRTDDIEEVGDNRHATFFEMLGFWSLGDYFKEDTIEWMFEFLTAKEWLGLDPKRLFVTVYKGNKSQLAKSLPNLNSDLKEISATNSPSLEGRDDTVGRGLVPLERGEWGSSDAEKAQNTHPQGGTLEAQHSSEEVESDEEAVVFWQKQFEKVGLYADVGEEFDFAGAKLQKIANSASLSGVNSPDSPKIWNFEVNSEILQQIQEGHKTIETKGNLEDIKATDLVKFKNGTNSSFWTIDKIETFANLEAAVAGLDFSKVFPEIAHSRAETESFVETTNNSKTDQKAPDSKTNSAAKSDHQGTALTNLDTQTESNQSEGLENFEKNQNLGEKLTNKFGEMLNVFKKDDLELKLESLQKPSLTQIQELYRAHGVDSSQFEHGLTAVHLGQQLEPSQVGAYLGQDLPGQQLPENHQNLGLGTAFNSDQQESENSDNQLLILSGPSGSGKSTITRHLLESKTNFELSISCTTRDPRGAEENGKDYYFLSREEFETKIKNNEFVEWQEVYLGSFYGTLKSEIERIWTVGKIPIFDIDYAGALNLKRLYPQAVDIFLEAPSLEILEERLRSRGTESEEKIATRLEKAKIELEHKHEFGHCVINREWHETIDLINQILLENSKTEVEVENLPQVLFASTNATKIADFRQALQDVKIEILTLKDLDYEIKEPPEDGQNNVQNAQIKAEYYWQNLQVKMPVIAQDNAKFLEGVAENDQPKENIKGIVEERLGNCEPETMVQFYRELATKYGGRVRTVENLAICLFDGQNISNETVEIETFLTDQSRGTIDPSYPISVLSQVKIDDELKFWQELSDNEKSQYLQPLAHVYQKLITDLQGFNRTKVILIHGGDSFDSYEAYLENLKATPAKWQQSGKRWKDTLGQFLGDDYQVCSLFMPNAQNASFLEWQIQFDKIKDSLDDKTVLVGHSLGGIFLAKYLAEQNLPQKVSQVHLVATPFEPVGSFELPENLSQLQANCQQIYLYHSQDDTVVDFGELAKYQVQLPQAQTLSFAGRGHFLQSEFPELVEQIKKNKRLQKISTPSKIEKTAQNPELELEKPSKYIYRITKKSGKDNWWGLPYRGPCGPCSEVYYLLNHNDINFEQTQFPNMDLDQIEDFVESQIIEIGNNVFMMYEGEKDANKEPVDLKPLAKPNIDTGLGFERFLAVINGMESIHDTDCLKPISDVARRWAKVGKV